MSAALQLIRVEFDSMENHNPLSEHVVCVFADGGSPSAIGKASDWFAQQEPVKLYAGYDGRVYPRFELRRVELK